MVNNIYVFYELTLSIHNQVHIEDKAFNFFKIIYFLLKLILQCAQNIEFDCLLFHC